MKTKAKAERLHKNVKTFILTCVGSDGYPLTKAVVPGKYRESLNELYFCTNTSTIKSAFAPKTIVAKSLRTKKHTQMGSAQ